MASSRPSKGERDGGFQVLAERADSVNPEAALLDRPALRPVAVERLGDWRQRGVVDAWPAARPTACAPRGVADERLAAADARHAPPGGPVERCSARDPVPRPAPG